MANDMLTTGQREAKLAKQARRMSHDELREHIAFAKEEIALTPSDRYRAEQEANVQIFGRELDRRGMKP